MQPDAVPAWCRWRAGSGPLLVVAPHGGRRDAVVRPGRKVNDLHTADLADELARALDASLVVNPSLDRNQLDLNRISQVTARAPWFLALLETLIEQILAGHPCAELLFVHGWNVVQPKCDIGVGRALHHEDEATAHAADLTATPHYVGDRLARLRAACAARGIRATFGERYPARHPNNLLQLFRCRGGPPAASPRLAAWAAEGRLAAVQLELGVPLRWPGPWRGELLAAAQEAFVKGRVSAPRPTIPLAAPPHQPAGLQFYDPTVEVGLSMRLDAPSPSGVVGGRLLLFLGRRRVALFTGEDRLALSGGGPYAESTAGGTRVRFDGSALATDDGQLYVDLEQAFSASQLCAVTLDLRFAPHLGADYGHVHGELVVDGVRLAIDTHAFARPAILTPTSGAWTTSTSLAAAFGPLAALRVRQDFPGRGTVDWIALRAGPPRPPGRLTIDFSGDRHTPRQFAVDLGDGHTLYATPLTHMAITRPLAHHRYARVSFGVAHFTHAIQRGFGFYEYARALV
ncbi:MAG: hypothetical protein ACRERC_00190 [Candidatus Binatia bacterium]